LLKNRSSEPVSILTVGPDGFTAHRFEILRKVAEQYKKWIEQFCANVFFIVGGYLTSSFQRKSNSVKHPCADPTYGNKDDAPYENLNTSHNWS